MSKSSVKFVVGAAVKAYYDGIAAQDVAKQKAFFALDAVAKYNWPEMLTWVGKIYMSKKSGTVAGTKEFWFKVFAAIKNGDQPTGDKVALVYLAKGAKVSPDGKVTGGLVLGYATSFDGDFHAPSGKGTDTKAHSF